MKPIIVDIAFIFFWIFFIMALVGIIKPSLIGKLVGYLPNPIGEFLGKINTGNFVTSRIKTVIVYLLMALLMFNIQHNLDISGDWFARARQAFEDKDYNRAAFLLREGIDKDDENSDEAQKLLKVLPFTAGKDLFDKADSLEHKYLQKKGSGFYWKKIHQGNVMYNFDDRKNYKTYRYAASWLDNIKDDDENYDEAQELLKLATGNYNWYMFNDFYLKYDKRSEKFSDKMKNLNSIPEGHPFADSITVGIKILKSLRRYNIEINLFHIGEADWCYPDCQNPTGAFKFTGGGGFNVSNIYFGGFTRWGQYYIPDEAFDEWFNNGFKGPNKVYLTYLDGRQPGEQIMYYYGNTFQIGETVYTKYIMEKDEE